MKNTDPLMGAKLKSKSHLQNKFFDFCAVFCAFGFKVCKKCKYDPPKFFFLNQKTQNFTLISNPLKKFKKNAQKKSYKQNKFDEHE
jgi:hypothetical protein